MKHLFIVSIFVLFYFANTAAQTNANIPGPENVLVIYNTNDDTSRIIAEYYASKRNIPSVNICGLENLPEVNITIDGVTHTLLVSDKEQILSGILMLDNGSPHITPGSITILI